MAKSSVTTASFPVAQPIPASEPTPGVEGAEFPAQPGGANVPGLPGGPIPQPALRPCSLSLPQGCYQLNFTTTSSSSRVLVRSFKLGSLRVETSGTGFVISGDTYRYALFDLLQNRIPSFGPTEIAVYPRSRYGSYLKATGVSIPKFSIGPCRITLNLDEYDYKQPPAGGFDGSFPGQPSRSLKIDLTPASPPSGFTGAYFTGAVSIGGVLQAGVTATLAWVSARYRKATVEVHTMTGAAAPGPVGAEDLSSVFANANWDMTVKTDPTLIPTPTVAGGFPAGWSGTSNWGSPAPGLALLHQVMTSLVGFTSIDLDREWYIHLLVVQAAMAGVRGVMFDSINVPREGVASFSDDGYPRGQSANFGAAADKKQRDVPRAFLRSAAHELTHAFNQVHQENEGGADNSIMTTTPSVADFLASNGGTFPDGIFLGFNAHVRHHLIHLPDIVIRPGGMSFTAGHNGIPVPQSDTDGDEMYIDHPALDLVFAPKKSRLKIGEPLQLDWEVRNISDSAVWLPGDLSIENEFAEISVTKPGGDELQMPAYAIRSDSAFFVHLKAGDRIAASHSLFWSPQGFAFDSPGNHRVNLEISWRSAGATVGKKASIDVFVDYPLSDQENQVIAHMLTEDVGKFVALGGHAYHLQAAVDNIEAAIGGHKDHPACTAMADFYDARQVARQTRKK